MWTVLALITATVLIPTIAIIGLFRVGALKRPEDLQPPPEVDEWAASQELKTPK
jgi:hypothetical protein